MSRIAHPAGPRHADVTEEPRPLVVPTSDGKLDPAIWSSRTERRPGGELAIAGITATELLEEFGSPLYVIDEADFRDRAREYHDALAPIGSASYAAKAFLTRAIAAWVNAEGLGLDVCSGGELAVARAVDFPGEKITLHGNNKSAAELEQAIDAKVGRIVIDSFDEIDRLEQVAAAKNIQVQVLVRVTVGVEAHTHEFIATAHEDQKFGFSLVGGDALEAVRRILDAAHLDLIGLHSHIGSQIFDSDGFEIAAARVLALRADIRDQLGVTLGEINLGGGLGIAYVEGDDPGHPADFTRRIAAIVERECRDRAIDIPQVGLEPGRGIAGPAGTALYRVGTVKTVRTPGGFDRRYISVDGGMSDNIRPALYDADYTVTLAGRDSSAEPVLSRVVGKHCESGDILVRQCWLPDDIVAGDVIAIASAGAYQRSMASNYNYLPRPAVVAVAGGKARVLLRRETIDDLLRLDVGT